MTGNINGMIFFDEGPRTGVPLILIHGFPFDHSMWEPQVRALSKDYRVITYDLRGHGQSEVGDGQVTVESFVDDLLMLLDHLKITQAVVCGLSLGGYIALRAVERHAERFSALVLCDTKSGPDTNEAKIKRAAAIRAIKKDGVVPFSNEFIKTTLGESTRKTNAALVESVLSMIRGNTPLGICGTLLALAGRTDTTPALAKMALPALLLVGEEDRLTPPEVSESMLKALPQGAMRRIPAAGHLSNLENTPVFNGHLLEFLKRVMMS